MFDNIIKFFKKFSKEEKKDSKDTAKERLHLVLMQDRANVSADFLEMMKQEIIEVIKKYIDVDENSIDVRLTNKPNGDGTVGAPALYANIPIVSIKEEAKKIEVDKKEKNIVTENKLEKTVEQKETQESEKIVELEETTEPLDKEEISKSSEIKENEKEVIDEAKPEEQKTVIKEVKSQTATVENVEEQPTKVETEIEEIKVQETENIEIESDDKNKIEVK